MIEAATETTLFNYARRSVMDFPFDVLDAHRSQFTDDFVAWLPKNLHIFAEFCGRDKAIKKSGRKHYSAYTIVETIRFHTDMRSNPDTDFKINNNYRPYLARLCMLAYPETDGMFETRETKKIYENGAAPC